ncbi:hypothetical protein JCM11491_007050 [Sporobolomyces phaffii]
MPQPGYIEPAELEALLPSPSTDFVGGNLPGAINLTTDRFSSPGGLDRVISEYLAPAARRGVKLVVVHCMRSQTRGPYVAECLARSDEVVHNLGIDVKILRGGYQAWYRRYYSTNRRRDLFENLKEDDDDDGWRDVVEAREGDRLEATDSKEWRHRLNAARSNE